MYKMFAFFCCGHDLYSGSGMKCTKDIMDLNLQPFLIAIFYYQIWKSTGDRFIKSQLYGL